jgi:hypothetical protein
MRIGDDMWMQLLNQDSIANAIRPKSWGPACWRFLDCLAFSYPATPSADQQANMAAFFHALKNVLPCYSCRTDFTRMMENEPIERHLHSRESLTRWLNDKHNQVNQKLGVSVVPYPVYVTEFCQYPFTTDTIESSVSMLHGGQVHASSTSSPPALCPDGNCGRTMGAVLIVVLAAGLVLGLISNMKKRK